MTHDCTSTATETTTTTATATASTVSHESTPLTQATSSTARANIFGPPKPTPSSSRVRRWSGLFWKVSPVTIILLVSLSTIVLSFRLAATSISSRDRSNSALLPLSRPPQKQTRLRGSNEETELEEQDNPMKLSLWLVPPGGDGDEEGGASESASETNSVFARTQKVIDDLSAQRNGSGFTPHVTLVGGIKVGSEPEALALAERLRNGLSGFGPVDCSFGNLVLSAPDCWNQALVLELVPPSEAFLRLCRASRKLLGMEQTTNGEESCLTFPPPLGVPHMSLYYGDSPPPPSDEYRSRVFGSSSNHEQSFRAHRVMLWKTDPSSAEGVPEWEPLADISLL